MTAPIGSNLLSGIGQGGDVAHKYAVPVITEGEGSFGDALKRVVSEASDAQDTAQDAIRRYAAGEPVELHDVMAAQEEATLALELMVEVRNKVTEAYRTLVNMQS